MTADKPIPFSAPMIRALLDGRKTQTRRVLTKLRGHRSIGEFGRSDTPGYDWHFRDAQMRWHDLRHEELLARLQYQVGDRLWVREPWCTSAVYDDLPPRDLSGEEPIQYAADGILETWGWPKSDWCEGRGRPGMFMPRWASRLTLTVTDVRVQRLQDISIEDAKAEGIPEFADDADRIGLPGVSGIDGCEWDNRSTVENFRNLWDGLNDARGYGWDANPWVAAYTFTVREGNIDQEGEA